MEKDKDDTIDVPASHENAYFAGGCFWCIEAVFRRQAGVIAAVSGYAGGTVADPTYEDVCTGETGHTETVKIAFDPVTVSYADLLDLFFRAHDPTSLNRQGADTGTQYRSAIFHTDKAQERAAAAAIRQATKSYGRPAVTELRPLDRFYPAEEYHQDFFSKNPANGYCSVVIRPKLKKLGIE
jgi:peptide-methionine (S)-S-oxide reductase